MVVGQVGFLIDGRQLKLVGRNLVVSCLDRNAQAMTLNLQVEHKLLDTHRDGTEVVVLELLVLGAFVTHQCAAGQCQVGAGCIQRLVDQKVFLFPAQIGDDMSHIRVKQLCHCGAGTVDAVQCTQQRGLIVERLAAVGDEDGGDAQRVVVDEGWRRDVPGRVATGLERVANAAVRKTRRIGLLLHQQLAAELLDDTALAIVLDKRVVFLGCAVGQRMKPVGVVSHPVVQGPLLHTCRHIGGQRTV